MDKKSIYIGSILIVVVFLAFNYYLKYQNKAYTKDILKNYQVTTGHIVKYSISGDADNRILVYSYSVHNKNYNREITPNVYYDECQQDIKMCENKKFHVIYSTNSHEMSLIDLTHEINEIDSVYVKNNIKKFE